MNLFSLVMVSINAFLRKIKDNHVFVSKNKGLIQETSEQKSSGSYGLLGNDDKKKSEEDKKNNSKNSEDN